MIRTTASIVRRSIDLRAVPSGDGVVASRMEGMAAEDAAEAHQKSRQRAVPFQRFLGVDGAGRLEAAGTREQHGDHRAIDANEEDKERRHAGSLERSRFISPETS